MSLIDCDLHIECDMSCNGGYGYAALTRHVKWPGTPAVGMTFTGDADMSPPLRVVSIDFTYKDDGVIRNSLQVSLEGFDSWVRLISREYVCGKPMFERVIRAMLADGWTIFDDVVWTSTQATTEIIESS